MSAATQSPVWRMGLNLALHHRVFASFFLYSFCMGGFFPRLPEIQQQLVAVSQSAATALGLELGPGLVQLRLVGVGLGVGSGLPNLEYR